VSQNTTLAPNIDLSTIYLFIQTFSNSQQVWQCQNVLPASHTMHDAVGEVDMGIGDSHHIYSSYTDFWGQCAQRGQR